MSTSTGVNERGSRGIREQEERGNGTVGTNTGMEDQPPCEDNDEYAKMRGVGKNETPKEEMMDEN